MGGAVGIGPEEDDFVRLKTLGNPARITTNSRQGHVRRLVPNWRTRIHDGSRSLGHLIYHTRSRHRFPVVSSPANEQPGFTPMATIRADPLIANYFHHADETLLTVPT